MNLIEFSRICETLEGIPGRLEMIQQVSAVLPGLSDEELPVFVRFIMGRIFPDWSPLKLGIGPNLLYEAVAYVIGRKKDVVVQAINRTGDVGVSVEELLAAKTQTTFSVQELGIIDVYQAFEQIATVEGMPTTQLLYSNISTIPNQ